MNFFLFIFFGIAYAKIAEYSFERFLTENMDICQIPLKVYLIGQEYCGTDGTCKTPEKACAVTISTGIWRHAECVDVPLACQEAFAKKPQPLPPPGGFEVHERIIVDFQNGDGTYDCVEQPLNLRPPPPCTEKECTTESPPVRSIPYIVASIQSLELPPKSTTTTTTTTTEPPAPGSPTQMDVHSREVKELSFRAANYFNKEKVQNSDFLFAPFDILSATQQVVAGNLIKIKIVLGQTACMKRKNQYFPSRLKHCQVITGENEKLKSCVFSIHQMSWLKTETIEIDEKWCFDISRVSNMHSPR